MAKIKADLYAVSHKVGENSGFAGFGSLLARLSPTSVSVSPADAVVPRLLTDVDQCKLQILQNQGFAAGLLLLRTAAGCSQERGRLAQLLPFNKQDSVNPSVFTQQRTRD